MSLGTGVIYGTSKRQKLNTKSSTEAELVGADNVMPQMQWTLYFLEAQGYKIHDNILYQDNKSAVLLETNGRGSSGKQTRHINVRYFFIADRIKSKEIRIEYCPTGIMLADYFTKPLQGLIFRELRDMIMGNTAIVLPSSLAVPKAGVIPAVSPPQESRSVLRKESDGPTGLLTVLPAYGRTGNKKILTALPAYGNAEKMPKTIVEKKRILSWADIVSGHEKE